MRLVTGSQCVRVSEVAVTLAVCFFQAPQMTAKRRWKKTQSRMGPERRQAVCRVHVNKPCFSKVEQ